MNPFVKFMASPAGRITRVVAGIILVALGLLVLKGTGGIILGGRPGAAGGRAVRLLRLRPTVRGSDERPENPRRQIVAQDKTAKPGRDPSAPVALLSRRPWSVGPYPAG